MPGALRARNFDVVLETRYTARVYVDLKMVFDRKRRLSRIANKSGRLKNKRSHLQLGNNHLPADAHDMLEEHIAQFAARKHQHTQDTNAKLLN